MKVTVLMEDTAVNESCIAEHGLSLFIEGQRHTYLLDTGATEKTWENAHRLGIDPGKAEAIFLSHGHLDHSGGIVSFLEKHPGTKVYLQKTAGLDYVTPAQEPGKMRYIGIDPSLPEREEMVWLDGSTKIDDGVYILSGVTGRRCWPKGNLTLKIRRNGEILQDTFDHEQSLVMEEDGKRFLFSGCAHNGILNILDAFREQFGGEPDYVFTGFHMMKKTPLNEEEKKDVLDTAEELMKTKTIFYSGHCTGEEAYELLKEAMGERLFHMRSGLQLDL